MFQKKAVLISVAFALLVYAHLSAMEIREPENAELPEVAMLYHAAWHETYDVFAPLLSDLRALVPVRTPENCLKQWQGYCHKGANFFVLIALDNQKIVGVSFAGPIEDKNPKECAEYDCEVYKLYVLPELKQKGIGTQLLGATFGKLKALGFKKAVVRALTLNVNCHIFYEKKGGTFIAFHDDMSIYGFTL